jgi:hypothetical protein
MLTNHISVFLRSLESSIDVTTYWDTTMLRPTRHEKIKYLFGNYGMIKNIFVGYFWWFCGFDRVVMKVASSPACSL